MFDGELLGKRGDDYRTALATWCDDYPPADCVAWFEANYTDARRQGMLCEIKNIKSPIDYGLMH